MLACLLLKDGLCNQFACNQSNQLKGWFIRQEILSSFTHPQIVINLHEFLSSAEHKRRYFEECW